MESTISMKEAVGYESIACGAQSLVEHAFVLKQNNFFFIANSHGDIAPPGHCSLGLFECDTRILSHYALTFEGGAAAKLSAQSPHSGHGQIDLAISDQQFGGNSWDPKNCIHIRREFVLSERFVERLTLTSYLADPVDYRVALALGCDFADIFEVRGWKREGRGQFHAPQIDADCLTFAYCGKDGSSFRTLIQFHTSPSELTASGAVWNFKLLPDTAVQLEWQISSNQSATSAEATKPEHFENALKEREAHHAEWRKQCTLLTTAPKEFQAVLYRAQDDLDALNVLIDGERTMSAGIPWYSTVFGRDSIITSLQTLMLNPAIAKQTLRYLARHQGEKVNSFTEEEPGKIMHEIRRGEMARSREIPHIPYYGTIDATPLWLILLHETWKWTNDQTLVQELLPHAERAINWIEQYADKDGDGFVEYSGSASGKGLANQGWKDSGDGVPYPDGKLPEPSIALIEVQGYVYDAYERMTALYEAFSDQTAADRCRKRAADLRTKISTHFWIEDLGMFALALDGQKRPLPTVTSNMGHLLWSGMPDEKQARRMVDHLISPQMDSGWGIRTLSSAHPVFNPMSYHNGSVWPHDNAIIALGLSRYGFRQTALRVLESLHDAANCDEFLRLPELYCGITRTEGMHPVWYPVSCCPQAWAAGAFFMLLQAVLGIQCDAPAGVINIKNPALPEFVNEFFIHEMRVGTSKVSLQFERHQRHTSVNILSITGTPLQVRIELTANH